MTTERRRAAHRVTAAAGAEPAVATLEHPQRRAGPVAAPSAVPETSVVIDLLGTDEDGVTCARCRRAHACSETLCPHCGHVA